jgi:hypothetical protein
MIYRVNYQVEVAEIFTMCMAVNSFTDSCTFAACLVPRDSEFEYVKFSQVILLLVITSYELI